MRKSKFTDQQVAFALRQAETGTRVAEVCRKMGISEGLCKESFALSVGVGSSSLSG